MKVQKVLQEKDHATFQGRIGRYLFFPIDRLKFQMVVPPSTDRVILVQRVPNISLDLAVDHY